MATDAYRIWVARGRPFRRPPWLTQIRALAQTHKVTFLGDLGSDDVRHLQANNPQDHCPFSFTAWPVALPDYVVCAIDLANGPHATRILSDARAGRLPWLKYMNFAGKNYSRRRNGFWDPVSSSDNHMHLSGMSDHTNAGLGGYNPFVAAPVATLPGRQLMYMIQVTGNDSIYVSDGLRHRGIDWPTFVFYRDTLKLPYVAVPNLAALLQMGGPPDSEGSTTVNVDAAQLERAAFEGAQRAERE